MHQMEEMNMAGMLFFLYDDMTMDDSPLFGRQKLLLLISLARSYVGRRKGEKRQKKNKNIKPMLAPLSDLIGLIHTGYLQFLYRHLSTFISQETSKSPLLFEAHVTFQIAMLTSSITHIKRLIQPLSNRSRFHLFLSLFL